MELILLNVKLIFDLSSLVTFKKVHLNCIILTKFPSGVFSRWIVVLFVREVSREITIYVKTELFHLQKQPNTK